MKGRAKKDTATETLTIRVDEDFKTALFEAARKDDRTVSSYVVHAVKAQMKKDGIQTREEEA